jgi:hypothetical protein
MIIAGTRGDQAHPRPFCSLALTPFMFLIELTQAVEFFLNPALEAAISRFVPIANIEIIQAGG